MDLVGELNRLAGIPVSERLGAAGAANAWAGTTGLELVGALNTKAGLGVNGSSLELNGVLQRLGLAGYDQGGFTIATDAAGNPLLQNTLRLPGLSGNYLSTPDTAAISITGDIDIRVKVALDNWFPSTVMTLVAKYVTASPQRAWEFRVESNSRLSLLVSAEGATTTALSSDPLTVANGAVKWVRATRVQSSGIVSFYVSDDGINWTSAGTPGAVLAGSAFFDSTAPIELGSIAGGTGRLLQGHIYYAEVRSGIAGPVVAKFDSSTVAVRGDRLPATFTDASSNTPWTANGSDWWWGTSTGTQRYTNAIQLDEQYVYFPGTSGNYASTPDSAALSITGDIDLRIKVAIDNVATGTPQILISKNNAQRSYQMYVAANGNLIGDFSGNGTTSNLGSVGVGNLNTQITAGVPVWLRVTRASATGLITGYKSNDGVTWTQMAAISQTTGAIFDSADPVYVGANFNGGSNLLTGKVYYAEIRNGIGGTRVGVFSAMRPRVTAVRTPTTLGSAIGETWTLNGAAWEWGPYTASPIITTPDSAALSITGDIDIQAKATLTGWTTMPNTVFIGKRTTAAGGYQFRTSSTGRLELVWADGTSTFFRSATEDTPFAPGATGWVRATLDVDNGAVGHDAKFYTSTDGVTWTQLGATSTTAAVTAIGDSSDALEVGSVPAGTLRTAGLIHYAEVRNGIGGTVVGVFNPSILKYPSGQTPTTLKSPTGETWTISGSGWRWIELGS